MSANPARARTLVEGDSLAVRLSVLDGVARPVFVMLARPPEPATIVFVNAALCEATGLSREEALAAGPAAWLPAEARGAVLDALEHTLRTGRVARLQFDALGAMAECRRIRVGRHTCCMVTQMMRPAGELLDSAHAELAHRAELLSTAMDLESMAAWTWTRHDDRVQAEYVSSAGDSPRLDIGTLGDFVASIHPGDRERVEQAVGEALKSNRVSRFEFRVRTPDGTERWFGTAVRPFFDNAGAPAGLVGSTRDVTSRKLAYRRVAESEERLRHILEAVPVCVKVVDGDGALRLMNAAGLALIEADDVQQVYGRRAVEIVAPEHRAAFEAFHERVMSGEGATLEFEIIGQRGTRRWVESKAEPLRDRDGVVTAALGVTRDITERRQLAGVIIEAANREQERIGRDLHDSLGQELTGISLMLKGLEGHAGQRAPELVREIGEILGLVQRALGSTRRLAHGLAPVALERGGLTEALRSLVDGVRHSSGVRARLTLRVEDPSVIDTPSALHLYRIAQEAVHNALRHASPGTISVSLGVRNGRLRLRIADDGRGLSGDGRARQGLGLRTMEYRAQMIGATLSVEQLAAGGTAVVVTRQSPAPGAKG